MVSIVQTPICKERTPNNELGPKHVDATLKKRVAAFEREMATPPVPWETESEGAAHRSNKNDIPDKKNTSQDDPEILQGQVRQALYAHRQLEQIEGKPEASEGKIIPEISRDIVDKILVNDSRYDQTHEVRIFLKSTLLPETEVHITHNHGRLHVELATASTEAFHLLQGQQVALQESLNASLGANVDVKLSYDDTGSEQNQGRSRNRQDLNSYLGDQAL